ncbi:MAG: DUF2815 family protein [Clostridia bacterium]|nr:DUF2815 family protein [Clostridia bacterium]
MANQTRVVTGIVRLSYANIWDPKTPVSGGEPRYSCSIIIPKSDTKTVEAIRQAIECAIQEGAGKYGGKIPNRATLKLPLRDGDTEREDEPYKNSWFINATSKTAPQVVDRHLQQIMDRSEIYSGVYAKVSLSFYAFSVNGNRGVACGLGNIQKIRDGEPLGGTISASDEFSEVKDEDSFLD